MASSPFYPPPLIFSTRWQRWQVLPFSYHYAYTYLLNLSSLFYVPILGTYILQQWDEEYALALSLQRPRSTATGQARSPYTATGYMDFNGQNKRKKRVKQQQMYVQYLLHLHCSHVYVITMRWTALTMVMPLSPATGSLAPSDGDCDGAPRPVITSFSVGIRSGLVASEALYC